MKRQNGDARTLGTRRAVMAVAVSLYAAMAGAQTNPADSSTGSAGLVVAQASAMGCPAGGGPG
ncbi:hypothetical protein CIC12_20890, partial [Burkholderia sp. SG-MS1]|nr:hypothetical protein [Paraburkholderia sp. SG-MS1]